MKEEGIDLGAILAQIEAHEALAETIVVVARNGDPIGLIAIADALKATQRRLLCMPTPPETIYPTMEHYNLMPNNWPI
jgi:hypothetical protein